MRLSFPSMGPASGKNTGSLLLKLALGNNDAIMVLRFVGAVISLNPATQFNGQGQAQATALVATQNWGSGSHAGSECSS